MVLRRVEAVFGRSASCSTCSSRLILSRAQVRMSRALMMTSTPLVWKEPPHICLLGMHRLKTMSKRRSLAEETCICFASCMFPHTCSVILSNYPERRIYRLITSISQILPFALAPEGLVLDIGGVVLLVACPTWPIPDRNS
jgi:hypothetical protein